MSLIFLYRNVEAGGLTVEINVATNVFLAIFVLEVFFKLFNILLFLGPNSAYCCSTFAGTIFYGIYVRFLYWIFIVYLCKYLKFGL
jgi:hypothetical protein